MTSRYHLGNWLDSVVIRGRYHFNKWQILSPDFCETLDFHGFCPGSSTLSFWMIPISKCFWRFFFKLFKPWSFGFPNHEVFILNYHFSWFWTPKIWWNIDIIVVYVHFFGQINHPCVGEYRYLNIPLPWNLMILWDMKHVKKAAEVSTLRMGASELFRLDNCLAGASLGGVLGALMATCCWANGCVFKTPINVCVFDTPFEDERLEPTVITHEKISENDLSSIHLQGIMVQTSRRPGCNDHNSVIWDNYIGIHQLYRLWECSEFPICDLENSKKWYSVFI